MVALDWAKTFDSISPERLLSSLRRFGVPEHMVEAISAIYSNRQFFVKLGAYKSQWYDQAFSIVQGYPLSPFLFSVLMTYPHDLFADGRGQNNPGEAWRY